jgi:hypothetical protein
MIHKNISEEQNNSRLDQAATFLFKDYSRSQIKDGYCKAIYW